MFHDWSNKKKYNIPQRLIENIHAISLNKCPTLAIDTIVAEEYKLPNKCEEHNH